MDKFDSAKMQRKIALFIFAVSLIPLVLFACLSIGYFRAIAFKELEVNTQRLVEHCAKDITSYLQGKVTQLSTLTSLYSIEYLRDRKNLTNLLQTMNDKGHDSDIVALQLLDTEGDRLAHTEPSKGVESQKNYKDIEWFKQVLIRNVAVSDVYTDHPDAPNFAIALTNPLKTYVLQATIAPLVLGNILESVRINPKDEAYVLSANGVLQTPGLRKEGKLNTIESSMLKRYQKGKVSSDKEFLYASTWFDGNSWKLFLKSHIDSSLAQYIKYRNGIITVVLFMSACFVLFSIITSRTIIKWIEKRDRQQKALYGQLAKIEKMADIGQIASAISKEINMYLQNIQKQASTFEELVFHEKTRHIDRLGKDQDALKKIKINARCISGILDKLTFFYRKIDSGYNIQVNWILREFLSFYEKDARDRNIVLNSQFDEQVPTIKTDGSQIQQILLSLIENALDAVGTDGQIDIITYNNSEEVCVQIADSGPGVTTARMERLWQPFAVSGGSGKGGGVKLSMYSNIVYKLGGRISAKERPQGGTLITLSLPARSVLT